MTASALPSSALRANEAKRLRTGLMMSAAVHVGLVAAVVYWSSRPEPVRPPVYRVNLVGAPPGERQIGVVDSRPAPPAPSAQPAPSGAEQIPAEKVAPTKTTAKAPPPPKATPTPTKSRTAGTTAPTPTKAAAPPKAGSGATGGKGADVATIRTEGIAFPDQGYLNNIQRQLWMVWRPERRPGANLAEIKFTIHRDGRVTDIQVVKSSRDRRFDIEAQGAVEAVGSARKFGPLPAVWTDDVLIVYFTFDYAMLK